MELYCILMLFHILNCRAYVGDVETILLGVVESTLEHHTLWAVKLTLEYGDSVWWAVWLGRHPDDKKSSGPNG